MNEFRVNISMRVIMWWIFVKIFDLIKNCTLILNYFAVMYKTSHIVQCVTLSDILSNKIYI